MRVRQPEELVIDEQLDDLAVGYVTDGLAGFCEAVGLFAIDDRSRFIESIDQSAVFDVGATFIRAPTHADIAIAQRHHGLRLRQEFGVKSLLDDVPFVGWVITGWRSQWFVIKHPAAPRHGNGTFVNRPVRLGRSPPDARHGGQAPQYSPCPRRPVPITSPNSPLDPASTPAMASSMTTDRAGLTPRSLAAARNVSGAGLPARFCECIMSLSTCASKKVSSLAAFNIAAQF